MAMWCFARLGLEQRGLLPNRFGSIATFFPPPHRSDRAEERDTQSSSYRIQRRFNGGIPPQIASGCSPA